MAQQRFDASCNASNSFPRNHLNRSNSFQHTLKSHVERLNEQENRLFHREESNAELYIWEYVNSTTGYALTKISQLSQLQNHLRGSLSSVQKDPQTRFLFIHAKHSRDPLRVTREMLMYAFTYHQVMPTFLDYLFLFGLQHYPQGFHFSGFRYENSLLSDKTILKLPDLGRSGRSYSMCYNLKSVEEIDPLTCPPTPWSIRQTAVYHSFDIESCTSFWVNVKGNDLIRDRIMDATKPDNGISVDIVNSRKNAFVQSLEMHLLLIDWSGEKWRWYINYLEELSDNKTRRALLASGNAPAPQTPSPPQKVDTPLVGLLGHAQTLLKSRTFSFGRPQPAIPLQNLPAAISQEVIAEEKGFSFEDLQEVQHFEEKTNEVLLVLESNINIATHIRDFYKTIFDSSEFPQDLKDNCKSDMTVFCNTVCSVVNDLKMQLARAKMLRAQITDRKGLFNGILNYRSMEATKRFAEEARRSTIKMEYMTHEMNAFAQKTKQETVSMRIITLVTLFFLPGTFISTMMSTDIIQFKTDPNSGTSVEDFSPKALWLFLMITLPLMAATFICWAVVYRCVNRRQNNRTKKLMDGLKADFSDPSDSPV